jgi:ABC-type uncharacterized transport system permease subunit
MGSLPQKLFKTMRKFRLLFTILTLIFTLSIGVACGGVVYWLVYTLVFTFEVDTELLKMISAILVAFFLAVPYLKKKYFTKQKIFEDASELEANKEVDNA